MLSVINNYQDFTTSFNWISFVLLRSICSWISIFFWWVRVCLLRSFIHLKHPLNKMNHRPNFFIFEPSDELISLSLTWYIFSPISFRRHRKKRKCTFTPKSQVKTSINRHFLGCNRHPFLRTKKKIIIINKILWKKGVIWIK